MSDVCFYKNTSASSPRHKNGHKIPTVHDVQKNSASFHLMIQKVQTFDWIQAAFITAAFTRKRRRFSVYADPPTAVPSARDHHGDGGLHLDLDLQLDLNLNLD